MKNNVILMLHCIALLFIMSCSSDDDNTSENDNPEVAIAELLVNNSPWTFTEYQLLQITDAGSSTMSQQEIENQVNSDFNQLQLQFNANGTGMLNAPILNSSITWELQSNGGHLYLVVNELTPPDDETLFTNVIISQNELRLDNASTVYDASADYNVGVLGTMVFNN